MNKKFNTIRYKDAFRTNTVEEIRISKVLNLIGSKKSVLDIGCGDGFFMERIRDNGNHIIGIEIANKAIEGARKKGFKVYDLLLDNNWSGVVQEKFDVVFAGEIIEHIFDTDNLLQNIRRVLKDTGYLVLTTPNVASLGRRILLLLGKNPFIEVTARSYDAGHIRYFTRDTLMSVLIQNGFKVEKMESSVINFTSNGSLYSEFLAIFFPSFGNNIITKAKI